MAPSAAKRIVFIIDGHDLGFISACICKCTVYDHAFATSHDKVIIRADSNMVDLCLFTGHRSICDPAQSPYLRYWKCSLRRSRALIRDKKTASLNGLVI